MYISVKLPPGFGSFNQLRKENYPFNKLFTAYLAAVSRLGLSLGMDVPELVGYIEDKVFDGQRLPDVPEGDEPVNFRYKTEDSDVIKYIGQSSETNRRAILYIARMTLRLSAVYGTSLFRLVRLISDLDPQGEPAKTPKKVKEEDKPKEKPISKPKKEPKEEPSTSMPRISSKAAAQPVQPVVQEQRPATLSKADAARAAVSELTELAAQVDDDRDQDTVEEVQERDDGLSQETAGDTVETSPYLSDFLNY